MPDPAIDRVLHGPPSSAAWGTLLQLLEASPTALDDVERGLAGWPDDVRAAPARAWVAARDGEPPAWWPLVRRVQLEANDAPDPAVLARVTSLVIDGRDESFPADWLAELPHLETLDVSGVHGLTSFTELPALPALHTLHARGCFYLEDLSGLEELPALRVLSLSASPVGVDFATLPALPQLRVLEVDRCRSLADLAPLVALTALEQLSIADCPKVAALDPLAHCRALRWLDATRLPKLRSVAPLAPLAKLATLWLGGEVAGALAPLVSLALRELVVRAAPRVDAAAIGRLAQLEELQLVDVGAIELADLAPSPVARLSVVRCEHAGELAALARLANVWQLVLRGLPELTDLAAIGAMPALRDLAISGCDGLSDISGLSVAHGLTRLAINDCPAVTDATAIAALPALRSLDLSGTPVTRGLDALHAQLHARG